MFEDKKKRLEEDEKNNQLEQEKIELVSCDTEKLLKEQESKIQELTTLLQRLQADFDNFRKRSEKNSHESVQKGAIDVISKLLPILDSFEMALKNIPLQDEVSKGMHLVYIQLFDLFKSFGLKPIDTINIPFDTYKHEALMCTINNNHPENTVLEIFQKGFMLNDYVLRYAKVKVSVHSNEIGSNQESK